MTHCVDDVCLYEAKKQKIVESALNVHPEDEENRNKLINSELELLPIRSAPLVADSTNPQYKQTKLVEIKNEMGITSGKFGWCFICRNTAKNYCKDTRVPICSESCKL